MVHCVEFANFEYFSTIQ